MWKFLSKVKVREQNKDIWFLVFNNMISCLLLICRYGNANVWKTFTDLFDFFPLTALVSILSFPCVVSCFVCDLKHISFTRQLLCKLKFRIGGNFWITLHSHFAISVFPFFKAQNSGVHFFYM